MYYIYIYIYIFIYLYIHLIINMFSCSFLSSSNHSEHVLMLEHSEYVRAPGICSNPRTHWEHKTIFQVFKHVPPLSCSCWRPDVAQTRKRPDLPDGDKSAE